MERRLVIHIHKSLENIPFNPADSLLGIYFLEMRCAWDICTKDVNCGIVWDSRKHETKCPPVWLTSRNPCYRLICNFNTLYQWSESDCLDALSRKAKKQNAGNICDCLFFFFFKQTLMFSVYICVLIFVCYGEGCERMCRLCTRIIW